MDKYIFDESNGLWYERQGDYYIPCLTLPAEDKQPIGLWEQMAQRQGVTEQLKVNDQMAWVGKMNSIRANAMEIVNKEIIYT